MVPQNYTPEDGPEISRYVGITGVHGPLLQAVPSSTGASVAAQERLLNRIKKCAPSIRQRFSQNKTAVEDNYWLHDAKVIPWLLEYLKEENLAWHCDDPHGYVTRTGYALHPALGKAIMTTIGLSVASEQHYDIVTADGVYHEALLSNRENQVFSALLEEETKTSATQRTAAQVEQELGQLCITLSGVNYRALRPDSIPELQASKRFQAFQEILRTSASAIDREGDDERFNAQLREVAEKIITSWQDINADLSKDLREVLCDAALLADTVKEMYQCHGDISTTLAIKGAVGVFRIAAKKQRFLKSSGNPLRYLTEIVNAQDRHLKITFPLGLENQN